LLARTFSKHTLVRRLRDYLHEVAAAAGVSAKIVPHQLRHYAASWTMPRGSKRTGPRPAERRVACASAVQHAA
jgi:integrase